MTTKCLESETVGSESIKSLSFFQIYKLQFLFRGNVRRPDTVSVDSRQEIAAHSDFELRMRLIRVPDHCPLFLTSGDQWAVGTQCFINCLGSASRRKHGLFLLFKSPESSQKTRPVFERLKIIKLHREVT